MTDALTNGHRPEALAIRIAGAIVLAIAMSLAALPAAAADDPSLAVKMLWGWAAARLDILQVDQNLVRNIR